MDTTKLAGSHGELPRFTVYPHKEMPGAVGQVIAPTKADAAKWMKEEVLITQSAGDASHLDGIEGDLVCVHRAKGQIQDAAQIMCIPNERAA